MAAHDETPQHHPHHVLDFLVDDSDSCALTVYVPGDNTRIHIIANADGLSKAQQSRGSRTYREYARLVSAYRKRSDGKQSEHDSGVDVSEGTAGRHSDGEGSAEEALQSWMIEPVRRDPTKDRKQPSLQQYYDAETQYFELEIATSDKLQATELEESSELKRRMAKLKPEVSLPKYIRDRGLPWYDASKLTVLASSASPPPYHPTLVRCEETGEQLFFKAVVSDAPQSTKRELSILNRIERLGLVDHIRVPRLAGLVACGSSHTHAIGFLQQIVSDPTPLTEKLDAEVPQEKRDLWAAEAERMKKVLHEHDIVWGDAKGDNLLVDSEDRLWIIDFGGSYTEGWVDPEIKETEAGDDMGVEKVVNALHDPIANVEGAEEEVKSGSRNKQSKPEAEIGIKRKASEQDDAKSDTSAETKKHRVDSEPREELTAVREATPQIEQLSEPVVVPTPQKRRKSKVTNQIVERYCYCDSPSAGPMVGCDGPDCERQWFHFYCAGLKRSPPEDSLWFCRDCSSQ